MNCSVCGNPLHAGGVAFRCECKVLTHENCWREHVTKSHKQPCVVGTIDENDTFIPRESIEEEQEEAEEDQEEQEGEETEN